MSEPLNGTAEPNDDKICGCQKDTFIKIMNAICGVVMVITGLTNLFTLDVKVGAMIFIYLSFAVYQILFGMMITISFCKIESFFKYFGFMKTTIGKGWFDLFCCGMFFVASSDLMGYVIGACLAVFGIFFLVVGYSGWHAGGDDYDPKNIKKDAISAGVSANSALN